MFFLPNKLFGKVFGEVSFDNIVPGSIPSIPLEIDSAQTGGKEKKK